MNISEGRLSLPGLHCKVLLPKLKRCSEPFIVGFGKWSWDAQERSPAASERNCKVLQGDFNWGVEGLSAPFFGSSGAISELIYSIFAKQTSETECALEHLRESLRRILGEFVIAAHTPDA